MKNFQAAVFYHDIFDYPLKPIDLKRWTPGRKVRPARHLLRIVHSRGFYYLQGREEIIKKRLEKEACSRKKMQIARHAAEILGQIPTVKFIGVTGSLAMMAAGRESDIDFMIVTTKGSLWTTRLISYLVIWLLHIKRRKAGEREARNGICLNIWLDESDLAWRRKNVYTAHEIAQVVPLVNKERTCEKFIQKNSWIFDYWPRAIRPGSMQNVECNERNTPSSSYFLPTAHYILRILEPPAFWLQRLYMGPKMTVEVVTPTRALFHPVDWSKTVLAKFKNKTI